MAQLMGTVRIEATCVKLGGNRARPMVLEEKLDIAPILRAKTLSDATKYFISATGMVQTIADVRSFKIDGHEMLGTFI